MVLVQDAFLLIHWLQKLIKYEMGLMMLLFNTPSHNEYMFPSCVYSRNRTTEKEFYD